LDHYREVNWLSCANQEYAPNKTYEYMLSGLVPLTNIYLDQEIPHFKLRDDLTVKENVDTFSYFLEDYDIQITTIIRNMSIQKGYYWESLAEKALSESFT
jgi:hypothetical protein